LIGRVEYSLREIYRKASQIEDSLEDYFTAARLWHKDSILPYLFLFIFYLTAPNTIQDAG